MGSPALDDWAKEYFDGKYDPARPEGIYTRVIRDLFPTMEHRQRELEDRMTSNDPGFGYAIMAKLMAHDKYSRNCNVVVTT